MSSGTNVEVNATSMTPSAPVGGADALAPLTAALDKLHTALSSVETTIKALDIGKAFTVTLSNELSAFVSRFDTILTQFTTKFTTNLDKLLSNISVTAKGGRGGKKESRKDKEFRIELESNLKLSEKNIRDAQKQISVEIEANLKEAAKEIKTRRKNFKLKYLDYGVKTDKVAESFLDQFQLGLKNAKEKQEKDKVVKEKQAKEARDRRLSSLVIQQTDYGVKADKVAGSFLDNFKKSMEASKKAMTIPSPYNRDYLKNLNRPKDDKNYVTVTPTGEWSGAPAKDPNKLTSIPSPYSTFFRRGMSSDKEWKNFVTPTGSYSGNFAGDPKKVMAIPSPYSRDYLRNADKERKNPITPSFGIQPPSTPKVTNGTGGFDWKKLGTAAGLGFAFTGGAGIAAAAIVKLMPKLLKAFEPVVDLGNALVDSLDPFAEAVNTALTPLRDLANQLKRFSMLGGYGASFNMNRINAEFEANLNNLMGDMLKTISSVFSNPMVGIMDAANMIGKFVDMVDPAAMSAFQQTMRDTFAVIGTALRPVMVELTRMLRSFADHLHPILQGAMPRILSGLQAMAEAFERNIPLITLMLEKFLGDTLKAVDKSGNLFGEELKPEKLIKDFEQYQKGIKVDKETSGLQKFGERFIYRTDRTFELTKNFIGTATKILKLAGKEGGIEKNKEFLVNFLKSIIDKTKPPSTVGLARVTEASYGGVAEVGREAVRRAFEGSRLQDLTRKNNREDIETGTYNAFIKALEQWSSGSKIYEKDSPNLINFPPHPSRRDLLLPR